MTMAVCFKCGEIKFGAFCPCQACGRIPETEDELIISLAMTDHHFDQATLERIGEATKENGQPPELAPENREQIRQLLRECKPVLSELDADIRERMAGTSKKKPWWRFW